MRFTPDNQYVALKRPAEKGMDVPAAVMTCSFAETRLLTAEDAVRGF